MTHRHVERAVYFEEEAERLEFSLSAHEEMSIVIEGLIAGYGVHIVSGGLPDDVAARFAAEAAQLREDSTHREFIDAMTIREVAWLRSHYAECVNL